MKKFIVIAVIIMTLFIKVNRVYGYQTTETSSDIVQLVDTEVSHLVDSKKVTGAMVSVVQGEHVLLKKGYGHSNLNENILVDERDTAFNIGSVSKTFVALAALQLSEKGLLDLDAPITEYLDRDFVPFTYPITMHHLLTHTAGFEEQVRGYFVYDENKIVPLETIIKNERPKQIFKPGEIQLYSNYGTALAGYVIEKITLQSYFDYTEQAIFSPLEMNHSTFRLNEYFTTNLSQGYSKYGISGKDFIANIYPAGSMNSSLEDMSKYLLFLLNGNVDVISDEYKDIMFNQNFKMDDEFAGIGYIWNRHERNGIQFYDKKGETHFFFSRIMIYPEQHTAVFISFNTTIDQTTSHHIMNKITDHLIGPETYPEGKITKDISGHYVSTVSQFTSPEKIMNLLTPSRSFHITGSVSEGFKLNGEPLVPIGEDYYQSTYGNIKLIDVNGKTYLANNTTAFVKVPWYESNNVQLFIIYLFVIVSIIMLITSIYQIIKHYKKRNFKKIAISIPGLFGVPLLVAMVLQVFKYINQDLSQLFNLLKIDAKLVLIYGVFSIISTLLILNKKRFNQLTLLYSLWVVANLLIIFWLVQVNLLF